MKKSVSNSHKRPKGLHTPSVVVMMAALMMFAIWSSTAYGIVITVGDEEQYDYIILYSMGRYLETYEKQIAITFNDKGPHTLEVGEPVYIVAHGAPGIIGETIRMSGEDIANALMSILDLGSISELHIYVFACNAGTPYKTGTSLLSDLLDGLTILSKPIAVCGPNGCAITDKNVKPPISEQVIKQKYADCFYDCVQSPLEAKIPGEDKSPDTYKKIKDVTTRAATAFNNVDIDLFFQTLVSPAYENFYYPLGQEIVCLEKK